jgi:hypothetical protein
MSPSGGKSRRVESGGRSGRAVAAHVSWSNVYDEEMLVAFFAKADSNPRVNEDASHTSAREALGRLFVVAGVGLLLWAY